MTDDVFIWIVNRGIELGVITILLLPLRAILKRKAPAIFSYLLWSVIPISIIYNLLTLIVPKLSYYVEGVEPGTPSVTFSRIGLGICKSVLVAGMIGILLYELYSYISLQRCLVGCIRLRGNIYLAARINEPFTMGVLSPKIYLPSSVEEERYEYVIAHEEVHIARKDVLTRCVGSVLRTVFWFQPLMWLAYYLFINDMEDACDEAALRKRSMEYRIQYAEALVEVSYQAGKAGSVAIGYGSGEIKKRIKHVLEYKKPKLYIRIAAVAVCIAFLFFAIPVSWQGSRFFQVNCEKDETAGRLNLTVKDFGTTVRILPTEE